MPRDSGDADWVFLPIDPDVDVDVDARHHPARVDRGAARPRARTHPKVLAVVFVGGCAGGVVRYAVTQHWPTDPFAFPWPTFAVNVAGAFVLASLVVAAARRRAAWWLRPLVGTGFCGALTTFASVVVAADRMVAHGRGGDAVAYLVASIVAGTAAAFAGARLACIVPVA